MGVCRLPGVTPAWGVPFGVVLLLCPVSGLVRVV